MLELFKLWITKSEHCSCCNTAVKKSEFSEDKFKRGKYNYCNKCQEQLKKDAKNPPLNWEKMERYYYTNRCPHCKSYKLRLVSRDQFDHTGDVYQCRRCGWRVIGYELDEMREKAEKKFMKKMPKPTKNKNVAQLKCRKCGRVFRQDNHKFLQSGRCPSCDFYGYKFLRYVEPRKK